MGPDAAGAVFDATCCIPKTAAALIPQRIQGAIAEQAVELFLRDIPVTGKIFTVPVLKKLIMLHISLRRILCYDGKKR